MTKILFIWSFSILKSLLLFASESLYNFKYALSITQVFLPQLYNKTPNVIQNANDIQSIDAEISTNATQTKNLGRRTVKFYIEES